MTVKELKEALELLPENMEVFVAPRVSEFAYGLVNTLSVKELTFAENPDFAEGDLHAKDNVVVIDVFE